MPGERSRASNPDRLESGSIPPESGALHESTSKAHVSQVGRGAGSPEWQPRLALAAAIGVPLVVVMLALRFAPARAPLAAKSIDAAVSAAAASTDPPLPKTANAEAAAAYLAGQQAVRDGSLVEAINDFSRAAALDPTMAAAQLRAALYNDVITSAETRKHARAALALRASLSDSDREILGAVEPLYISPRPAVEESERRLDKLVASRPRDEELLFLSGYLFVEHRPRAELQQISERLLDLDSRFASAFWLRALVQDLELDYAGAQRSVNQCMALSPSAASCLRVRAILEDTQGDCAGLEARTRSAWWRWRSGAIVRTISSRAPSLRSADRSTPFTRRSRASGKRLRSRLARQPSSWTRPISPSGGVTSRPR